MTPWSADRPVKHDRMKIGSTHHPRLASPPTDFSSLCKQKPGLLCPLVLPIIYLDATYDIFLMQQSRHKHVAMFGLKRRRLTVEGRVAGWGRWGGGGVGPFINGSNTKFHTAMEKNDDGSGAQIERKA